MSDPTQVLLMGISDTAGPTFGLPVPVAVSSTGSLIAGGGGAVILPTKFVTTFAINAGITPVWTPAPGTRFNLMGYQLSIAGTLAVADSMIIQLLDGPTLTIANHTATLQTTLMGDTQIGVSYDGGFYPSTGSNFVLNIFLGDTITNANGAVSINVWGFEL